MEKLNDKPIVCLNTCDTYDVEKIKNIVKTHLEALGGIENILKKGKNVVVKPNMVMRKEPNVGATTHPALVQAVCEIFKEAGANVTLAESSGGLYNAAVMGMTYKTCGLADAAQKAGVRISDDFSEKQVYCEKAKLCKSFGIISPAANADVIVNLPKLKTHTIATMSCAVKNLYGIIPGIQKVELHSRYPELENFCDMLVDLNIACPSTLTVCDAIDVMEGNGPTAGNKTHLGTVISSLSPYALDLVAAKLIGLDYSDVMTIVCADKRGILKASDESFALVSDCKIDAIAKKLKLPDTKDKAFTFLANAFGGRIRQWLMPKPKINASICKGCGECVRNCPQKLISLKNGKAHINNKGCIHCFCCHELCRYKAVDIIKPFVLNI